MHLRILGSTVYVFLHEEERSLKSEKWAPRALKKTLVVYNGHTIYRVHIKEQNKVIRVKDFWIFENYESKVATDLPDYENGTPTFQEFLLEDNDNKKGSLQSCKSGKVSEEQSCEGQKVSEEQPREDRKVKTEEMQPITRGTGRKVRNAEPIPSTITSTNHKSRSGCTVKLSAKVQETKDLSHQKPLSPTERSSEIEKQKTLFLVEQSSEIEMQKRFSPIEQSSEIEMQKPLSPTKRSSEIENFCCPLNDSMRELR